MRGIVVTGLACALLVLLPGCKKSATAVGGESATVAGETSREGGFLAYAHAIDIDLPGTAIDARAEATRQACEQQHDGACSVLELVTRGADGGSKLVVRLAPAGVEALVAEAARGGSVTSRTTRAEDLAEAVADTTRQQAMLEAQHAKLMEIGARRDLGVSDLMTLSAELASVESKLADTGREAATQRRRIETNLLTFEWRAPYQSPSRLSRLGGAFGDFGDTFVDGIEAALEWLGFALPSLLLAFPLALLWRWGWRRATRRA
ncbi:DUF4349 domain-containing protein [Dokdonella sp. MW10]|uniref:DUF4349 domain-containing protein n=1 Tax=Dokdonella sp. MW10 TaxID=2992926 RepID=UPI003F80031E